MKNGITSIIMVAAAMAAGVACSGELQPGHQPGTEPEPEIKTVFSASTIGTGTKTTLGDKTDGKYPVLWGEGDCISVNGIASEALTADAAGQNKANFTVMGEIPAAPYTAIYPSSARVSENSVEFVSAQAPAEAGFDPSAAIMAVQSSDEQLNFHHLAAYMRITVTYPANYNRRATKAVFCGNGSEDVAGEFGISFNESGEPVLGAVVGTGEKSIIVTASEGVEAAAGASGLTNFIIAMPAQTFAKGFKLEFSDAKGVFLKAETASSVVVKQGVILNAPALTFTALDNTTSDLDEVEGGQLTIVWDTPVAIDPDGGTYGRVHRLNDGRLMATYTSANAGQVRFSSNNGNTWTAKTTILPAYTENGLTYRMDNIEFAQLSSPNPYKPGRIIYAVNERGFYKEGKDNIFKTPYHISVCTSDDNGVSRSELTRIYTSATSVGCYEPFVLELPDGTVQIYFADEMAAGNPPYQKIRVAESKDGGETWETPRDVCYTATRRDGMPTAMLYGDNIYLAIEHYETDTQRLHPQMVYNPISDNWKSSVLSPSTYRFDPFETPLISTTIYNGAPYIAQTDNYFVIAYQTVDESKYSNEDIAKKHRRMEVQICPKSEMTGDKFEGKMRVKTLIPEGDGVKTGIKWPAICPLGGDEFLAVYELHDISTGKLRVKAVRGRITTSTPEFE